MIFSYSSVLHFAGVSMLLLMTLLMYRIVRGPTTIDRIVVVNVIGTKTAVLLVIIGALFGQVGMFVDFALAYALLNFVGSLTVARYFHRKYVEGDETSPEKSEPEAS